MSEKIVQIIKINYKNPQNIFKIFAKCENKNCHIICGYSRYENIRFNHYFCGGCKSIICILCISNYYKNECLICTKKIAKCEHCDSISNKTILCQCGKIVALYCSVCGKEGNCKH